MITSVMLVLLIGMAGFAVDLGYWLSMGSKLQKAADGAALGGVVFMPQNRSGADTVARQIAADNGFATPTSTIKVEGTTRPTQLRVTIQTPVRTFFGSVFGLHSLTLTRTAVADFEGPVPMGSPENFMGNQPTGRDPGDPNDQLWAKSGSDTSPDYWINLAGRGGTKRNGDRYATGRCALPDAGCDSAGTNIEYDANNYFYALRVSAVSPGKDLEFQIYDPAFAQVGDSCNEASLNGADTLTAQYPDAATRYAKGVTAFCTGDVKIGGNGIATTYIVRAPDDTPWTDLDNPIINTGTCRPVTYPAYNPSSGFDGFIKRKLDARDPGYDPAFAAVFRRWVGVCRVPHGQLRTGDYILQMRSNADVTDPGKADPTINTEGHNRIAIRAGFTQGRVVDPRGMDFFARGRLPIFANASGADTRFHLARILPGAEGRILRVTLFDTGDAAAEGQITILAPDESPVSFNQCTWSRSDGAPLMSAGCTLLHVRNVNGFNGKSVLVDVPLPAGYTCDMSSPRGCWVKVKFAYPPGTTVADTTTWSAELIGDPVRLVE